MAGVSVKKTHYVLLHPMKILIIGDRHVGGYGLAAGQLSFVGHFIRQINKTGRTVSVEAYAHSTLTAVRTTLAQLPLERYDLIVMQAGKGCLDHPAGIGPLFINSSDTYTDLSDDLILPKFLQPVSEAKPQSVLEKVRERAQLLMLKSMALLGRFPRLATVSRELTSLLTVLRPHRHKVILLTPFPHSDSNQQWLRQQGKTLFMQSQVRQSFSVFDTDLIVKSREEYFLATQPGYLNAIGHELIGRALFDYYLAAPTIVAIHPIRRT